GASVTLEHSAILPTDTFTQSGAIQSQFPNAVDFAHTLNINAAPNGGAGRIILSGNNASFEGVTKINSGYCQVNSIAATGDNNPIPSTTTVNPGATLVLGITNYQAAVVLNGGTIASIGSFAMNLAQTALGTGFTIAGTPNVLVTAPSNISLEDPF